MTTLLRIELTCPVCIRTFSSQTVLPGDASGRKRTDFHAHMAGVQPLPYLVHTCSTCGYTGSDRDFGDEAHIPPTIAAHVWDQLAPRLPTGPLTGSDKYEFAAKVADWQGAAPQRIGELLLCATWCCVDEGDVEAERYFRRKAAWMFEAALESGDCIAPHGRARLTYLVGELWRRVGDLKTAAAWFDRVPSEIVAPWRQQWIINAAKQQRDDPREWFEYDGEPPVGAIAVQDAQGATYHVLEPIPRHSGDRRPAVLDRSWRRWAAIKRGALLLGVLAIRWRPVLQRVSRPSPPAA
jgi:uncharacterized protein (DUF2225 family)